MYRERRNYSRQRPERLRRSQHTADSDRLRRFGITFANDPALLMFLPADFKVEVREFSVASGHGLLVFNGGDQSQRCGFCPRPGETLMGSEQDENI